MHVIRDGMVIDHDFFSPPAEVSVADGLSPGLSSTLAAVPSNTPSTPINHPMAMTDGSDDRKTAGASPRTPEQRQRAWFQSFASDLRDLLGLVVGIAGVEKHCGLLTDYDYAQSVRPALEAWINAKSDYISKAHNPVAYVLGSFPSAFLEDDLDRGALFEEVVSRGIDAGLIETFGGNDEAGPDEYRLVDVDGQVIDEWTAGEFEFITDDPANLYALQSFLDLAQAAQSSNYSVSSTIAPNTEIRGGPATDLHVVTRPARSCAEPRSDTQPPRMPTKGSGPKKEPW